MIITFIGTIGGGKTASAVYEAYKYHQLGYTVYSNIKLSFPSVSLTKEKFDDLVANDHQLQNAVLLLDEVHIWLDSRGSMKKKNRAITYFILQTRKRNIRMLCTTQHLHQVDKRLRDSVDILVFCRNMSNQTSTITNDQEVFIEQQYVYQWREDQKPKIKVIYINPLFQLYDTREIVSFTEVG